MTNPTDPLACTCGDLARRLADALAGTGEPGCEVHGHGRREREMNAAITREDSTAKAIRDALADATPEATRREQKRVVALNDDEALLGSIHAAFAGTFTRRSSAALNPTMKEN